MDPPLVTDGSFTAAVNPSAYSWHGLLSIPMTDQGLGLRMGILAAGIGGECSLEVSTVTEQSGGNGCGKRGRDAWNSFEDGSSSKLVSTSTPCQDLNESNAKRARVSMENCGSKTEGEEESGASVKPVNEKNKSEPPKDYIHVRARRGQATDSHSLAERARREKISEKMKMLQDLVPGCNKVIGKALVLDEIINYIQSLQRQVEFLSMKLEAVNARLNPMADCFPPKELTAPTVDAHGMMYGVEALRAYPGNSEEQWLGMHVGRSGFGKAT